MSASCPPGCGVCCDPVTLTWDPEERLRTWTTERLPHLADPDTPDGWAKWAEGGWESPEQVREQAFSPTWNSRLNADFILAHWTLVDTVEENGKTVVWRMRCAKFDTAARVCTAYEDRPPICSLYPWYGEEPTLDRAGTLGNVCAYHDDVPGRRVLPLVEIRQGDRG